MTTVDVLKYFIYLPYNITLMKKYLYLLFIATALFSCTKEEAQTPDNLRQQMVDKWIYRSVKTMTYSAQGVATDSVGIGVTAKDFFEFKDDGSYTYSTLDGKELTTGTFTTQTTTRFNMKIGSATYICRVVNLDLENFVFAIQEPKVANQPYSETRFILYR
jgi:hypothetical protein